MLTWFAALVFAIAGIALIVARNAAAHGQALVLGGTIRPGCAVIEGVLLIALAVAVVLLGERLF